MPGIILKSDDVAEALAKVHHAIPRGPFAARDAARAAFRKLGVLDDAPPWPLDERPHWLFVYLQDEDDRLVVATVPLAELGADLLAKLEVERSRRVAVAFGETLYDAPGQWEIWARLVVGAAVHDPVVFSSDLADYGKAPVDLDTVKSWAGTLLPHVAIASHGAADPRRLDVAIAGYVIVREMM